MCRTSKSIRLAHTFGRYRALGQAHTRRAGDQSSKPPLLAHNSARCPVVGIVPLCSRCRPVHTAQSRHRSCDRIIIIIIILSSYYNNNRISSRTYLTNDLFYILLNRFACYWRIIPMPAACTRYKLRHIVYRNRFGLGF